MADVLTQPLLNELNCRRNIRIVRSNQGHVVDIVVGHLDHVGDDRRVNGLFNGSLKSFLAMGTRRDIPLTGSAPNISASGFPLLYKDVVSRKAVHRVQKLPQPSIAVWINRSVDVSSRRA